MTDEPRGTTSVWMDEPAAALHPLDADTAADVAIVGAGIAGLSVAHALIERGRSVVVLDDGAIGSGETSRTTAHLVNALDERYDLIERLHGEDGARLTAESHTSAIDRIESLSRGLNIACEFTRLYGYLFVPERLRADTKELIDREYNAATRAGIHCEILPQTPTVAVQTGRCLRFPNQAQFHPMRYMRGLARAIQAGGGRLFTGSHADVIKGGHDPHVVTSDHRTVRAKTLIVATNTPVNDLVTMHTKQAAYRTYVIGLRVPHGAVPAALFWDGFWTGDSEPYHYVRLTAAVDGASDMLIVGGEDHETGREHDHEVRFDRLERWARLHFAAAGEIAYRWSGQVMEPHDELAYIGPNPHDENVFIVTGDSGNGMTHATIAAIMLPDLIEGMDHPWRKLYSPSRFPHHAAGTAIEENALTLAEYRDWVTPHSKKHVDELKAGEGVVARIQGKLRAIYKRPDGTLVDRSAVCPHLLGIVRWNGSEKSWDCPCHGSRFSAEGEVINGPANCGLGHEEPARPKEA